MLIAASVHPTPGPLQRALSWRALREAGLISYGLYLWHWPIFVWFDEDRTNLTGWSLFALRLGITVAVSLVSYHALEQPIRRGWGSDRRLVFATPALAALVAGLVWARTPEPPARRIRAYQGQGGVLVLGDSLAASLYPGLALAGLPVRSAAMPACRLLPGEVRSQMRETPCDWRTRWSEALERQHPEVVVLMIGLRDTYDVRLPGEEVDVRPGDPAWDRAMETALDEALGLITASGAHVVVPDFPCLGTSELPQHQRRRVLSEPARRDAIQAVFDRVLGRYGDRVSAPDLFRFLCPTGSYQASLADVELVREDGIHFSTAGSALVARWLVDGDPVHLAPLVAPAD